MRSLLDSMADNVVYPELDRLSRYVQWTNDYAVFLEESAAYLAKLAASNEATVAVARRHFKHTNAKRIEEVLLDWCPLWRIILSTEAFLHALPALPWRHDETVICKSCQEGTKIKRALAVFVAQGAFLFPTVAAAQQRLRDDIRDIAACVTADDDTYWCKCVGEECALKVLCNEVAMVGATAPAPQGL